MSVLFKFGIRYLKKHILQSLLLILGVALGVSVIIAIDIANTSASRAFKISTESMTGRTTHQIISSKEGINDEIYTKIRTKLGFKNSAPVVEDYVSVKTFDNKPLKLFGVDPFAESPFRNYVSGDNKSDVPISKLINFLTKPNTIFLEESLANKYSLKQGDKITVQYLSKLHQLEITGILKARDNLSKEALSNVLISDISTAQDVLGKKGKLTHIDLIIDEKTQQGQKDLVNIKKLLPEGVYIENPNQKNSSLEQMSNAFELNLSALSLLALVVGMFLIYNTVTFSVVQRRPILGILRSIGVTKNQIFMMIISETLLLGVIGTVIGLFFGRILGQGALYFVSRTINDLYFTLNVTEVYVSNFTLLKGVLTGTLASVISSSIPALEATNAEPAGTMKRSVLEAKIVKLLPYLTISAILLSIFGTSLFFVPIDNVSISFTGLFIIILAFALLVPILTTLLMKLFLPFLEKTLGIIGKIASRNIIRSLSRSAVAISALMTAVSVIVGVSIMIGSFRQTVVSWLDTTLTADIFISSSSDSASLDDSFSLDLKNKILKLPEVKKVETARSVRIITKNYGSILLSSVSNDIAENRKYIWTNGDKKEVWNQIKNGSVMISESFSYHNKIKDPQNYLVELETPKGIKTFKVAGVYYDYSSDRGTILIDSAIYTKLWNDHKINSIAVFKNQNQDSEMLAEKITKVLGNNSELIIQSNQKLKESALDVFDRTFAITQALRLLSAIVAFIGVFSTLMSLQLERTREIGILRSIGMTIPQVEKIILVETGLMGITSGILSIPLGYVLALILIHVINVRSFGWSLELILEYNYFIQALSISIIASLIAGIYPALRIKKLKTSEAIRSE